MNASQNIVRKPYVISFEKVYFKMKNSIEKLI